jgi:UDP-N-acetylmuramyl pentapeptide phosphotransferase/UDP-N-acetylglucosamine-1-phosphate transferase
VALLPVIALVPVVETLAVILQVSYFKSPSADTARPPLVQDGAAAQSF